MALLADSLRGRRVLVTGGGPIGLLVLQVLHAVGVHAVTDVEPSPMRRAVAGARSASMPKGRRSSMWVQ